MITLASQAITITLQLASTIILARILTPDDYGTIAMVLAITAFAGLFRDLGLSSASIQKKDLTHGQQSNLFWLNIGMGAALTASVAAASPIIAWFYGNDEIMLVTIALSLNFIIGSFGAQHSAILMRDMQFSKNSIATIIGSLTTLITSVYYAYSGSGYWALVWGSLAGTSITSTLLYTLSPFSPGWIKKGTGVRGLIKFGINVTGFELVNYFHRNLDNVLIGRVCGPEALGFYSRAYSILMLPINAIHRPISSVAYTAFCQLQDHEEQFKNYYAKFTRTLAFLTMPVSIALFLSSDSLILLMLGEQWIATSPLFQILAMVAFIQPSAALRGVVVMSLGKSNRLFKIGLIQALITSTGFSIGIAWGPQGVAISYVISTYVSLPLMFYIAFRKTFMSMRDYWNAVKPIVYACTIGLATTYVVKWKFATTLDHTENATIATLILFIMTYVLIFAIQHEGRQTLQDIKSLIRPAKKHNYVEFNR